MMTVVLLFPVVLLWILVVVHAKQKVKLLLKKYGEPLLWMESNDTFKMIRKLKVLKEQDIIKEDDVRNYKIYCVVLKSSLLIIPILMLLAVVIKLLNII